MKDILYFNTLEDIKLIDMMRLSKSSVHDYSKDYLTLEALENGTFTLSIPANVNSTYMTSVSYSTDNGATWNTTTIDNTVQTITTPTIARGNKVFWKGEGNQLSLVEACSIFSSSGNFNVSGNIMSLLYGDNFNNKIIFPTNSNQNFIGLFYGATKLINAKNLILPATTLAQYCYERMFEGCSSLINTPELPATTIAQYCYENMFRNCTSLINIPSILSATTLAVGCYMSMFYGCSSIVKAPELPALQLCKECYYAMFKNCTNLNYIKAMFTSTPNNSTSSKQTQNWVNGVAATGTFVRNSEATWTTIGINGMPSGWIYKKQNGEDYIYDGK